MIRDFLVRVYIELWCLLNARMEWHDPRGALDHFIEHQDYYEVVGGTIRIIYFGRPTSRKPKIVEGDAEEVEVEVHPPAVYHDSPQFLIGGVRLTVDGGLVFIREYGARRLVHKFEVETDV